MAKFVFLDPAKPVAVWWPCPVAVPVDSKDGEAGLRETQTLNLRLVALSEERAGQLLAEGVPALIAAAVIDWDAVDEAGRPVPFERFGEIAGVPYVRDAVMAAYRDFIGRAPAKN